MSIACHLLLMDGFDNASFISGIHSMLMDSSVEAGTSIA